MCRLQRLRRHLYHKQYGQMQLLLWEELGGQVLSVIALMFGFAAAAVDGVHYATHHASALSDLAVGWLLLRYGIVYLGALVVGYVGTKVRLYLWLLLILPSLVAEHWLFLRELGTVSNLWPPLFVVDVLLLLPCLPLMGAGKYLRIRS